MLVVTTDHHYPLWLNLVFCHINMTMAMIMSLMDGIELWIVMEE